MRRSSVLILLVAVGVGSYLIGNHVSVSLSTDRVSIPSSEQLVVPEPEVASTDAPPEPTSTAEPEHGEAEPRLAPAAPRRKPGVVPGDATLWSLVADTRAEAGGDTGAQTELLEQRLAALPPSEIVEFARVRRQLDERAYTWKLWGAAMVIEDGCSDDCFRDFRAYVISLGRDAYEKALRDPDSLAAIAQDAETGDWENADDPAPEAYSSATGSDFPVDSSDLSGPPRGTPLDDDDEAALVHRYPQLAARFR
jgi:hypothetical protein